MCQSLTKCYLKMTTGNPASNLGSSDTPHGNTSDSQPSLSKQVMFISTQSHCQKNKILKRKKKQTIMDIDALSHSPTLHKKILQESNLNDLLQYSNSHQAYIFEKSDIIVNCSYVLIFLRQSICYVITPNTHQWYKISVNEIFESHKLVLCYDHLTHMVPIPPAELPKINAFTTIARLTFLQTQDEQVTNTHNPYTLI